MQPIHLIGNAHIDPVWLWQWQEGFAEVKATFRSALDRLNETPEFVFTCAGTCYYQWVEENAPDMFAEICARVKEGRWVPVGGMWIQPDLNMPSGESLTRQILYGQRYFAEKLGVPAQIGYNVDSFGQSAYLPQLYCNAGFSGYVWMRPNTLENPGVPQGTFAWTSPDGSTIPAFRIPDELGGYTGTKDLPEKLKRILEISAQTGTPMMCFYGVGNHGGGPTIEAIKTLQSCMAQAPGTACFSSPNAFFAQLTELYQSFTGEMQHHASGCYSTFSPVKMHNRRCENVLYQAEAFGVLSGALTEHKQDHAAMQRAWQNVLFNQFHDIMCGCSIRAGLEDAIMSYGESATIAAREQNAALQKISWQIDTVLGQKDRIRSKQDGIVWGRDALRTPVVLFNPNHFPAELTAAVKGVFAYAEDAHGERISAQHIRAERTNGTDHIDTLIAANVPALGYRLLMLHRGDYTPQESSVSATETALANSRIRASFSPETGALQSFLLDGKECLFAPTRAILCDISHCDTWAHGVFTFDREIGAFGSPEFRVLENGPIRAALRVLTHFGNSTLTQIYRLRANSDQLDVETKLDLQHKHVLVKLTFAPSCQAQTEIAEVPLGIVHRRQTGMEEPCTRFVALCAEEAGEGGIALLNNGKYSYSCANGELRLTIANSSMFADHYGQPYRDDTADYLDIGEQRFAYSIVPFSGSWTDANLSRRADLLHRSAVVIQETYHEGSLPPELSGLSVEPENISLECLKPAENGNGTIVRIRECCGRRTNACITLSCLGRSCTLPVEPFKQKTILFPTDMAQNPTELLLTEEPIA